MIGYGSYIIVVCCAIWAITVRYRPILFCYQYFVTTGLRLLLPTVDDYYVAPITRSISQ